MRMGVELDAFFTSAVFTLRQFGQSDIVRHHYIIVQVRIETDSAFYFNCIGFLQSGIYSIEFLFRFQEHFAGNAVGVVGKIEG